MVRFTKICLFSTKCECTKFDKTYLFFDPFLAEAGIQEHLLLARVRYVGVIIVVVTHFNFYTGEEGKAYT